MTAIIVIAIVLVIVWLCKPLSLEKILRSENRRLSPYRKSAIGDRQ